MSTTRSSKLGPAARPIAVPEDLGDPRLPKARGLVVDRIQVNPGFARLVVESADDRTELDLAADVRPFPVEPPQPAPMLTARSLQWTRCWRCSVGLRRVTSSI